MKRPVLAARKLGKISTELLERCHGHTPDLGMIKMKKARLETEWNTFDTLYIQWADTVDEQDIDQHHEGYEDIASAKDQALESATELISKDNILTWGQRTNQ